MTGPPIRPPIRPFELEPEPEAPTPPRRPRAGVVAEEGEPGFEASVVLEEPALPERAAGDAGVLIRRTTRTRRRAVKGLLGAGLLMAALLIGIDLFDLLRDAFARSALLGAALAFTAAAILAALAALAGEELRDLRRLDDISRLQAEAARLLLPGAPEEEGQAATVSARIAALYRDRPDVAPGIEAFRAALPDAHGDAETMALLSRLVLRPIDRRARRIVVRHASQTALFTALSPLGILDSAFVLWRSARMVREIAALYGGRPGLSGSVALFRDTLANVAVAGASDTAADFGADALGGALVASLSARAGQGVAVGMLTARLGMAAMRLCRPLPFGEEERPQYRRLLAEITAAMREPPPGGRADTGG